MANPNMAKIIQIAVDPSYVNADGETIGGDIYGLDDEGALWFLDDQDEWELVTEPKLKNYDPTKF